MKIKGLIVMAAVLALMLGSCAKQSITNAKLKNKVDSLSYAFGIMNYYGLQADSLQLNPVVVAKAMMEAEKEKAKMTEDIARGVIISFVTERQAEMAERQAEQDKVLYKDYIAENEAFLEKNKEKEGVTVTPSGLQYEVIKMGSGNKPTINSTVKVHYVGTLIDGTEFDSSVARGEPAQFPLSGVISGWTEALQLMPVGSKFRIYLPQELAYGGNQAGDKIKPFSTLIFDVELLEIVE
ncbi:MAG TPA: FKBP-type peptidyl-prolyl cis-trans isomerase [Bacteroidales bacterium]|jgi:FKBP-type peptidyl-prolyl cis-trans isomerase FklB|nr:FKBP-type peptidyl-prolyl cis-trans isomerase [Bacteroidota bacterium]MZP66079.1 FKBP-type peptidyl-prolyl cis-trans isomerase [Bacteroidales bacterium]NLK54142.1 FKBP-type peptidyl-prolyl cis-trans isomerase [Bacteroidales bacterium]HNY52029.1 FKBP-type peptidyl-prolyl cis-trans isomerase [Bacteroidales bacterium]HOG55832.1 FKBP-type peptidyl-prolyl cis-trans isomerase [Bacteroidales bacterium]